MVKAWVADITPLLEEEGYRRYYKRLPAWRREKADRLRFQGDRARSAGAWSLWEQIRSEEGLGESVIYNLSHSGDYVMCAYSDVFEAKVGCDLEVIRECREKVAERFFCPSEYAHLMRVEPEKRERLFYRYWTMKESFMKAVRQGMALDPRSFEIGWDREGRPVLKKKPEIYTENYYYQEYICGDIPAGIAVCSTDPRIDPQLHRVEL